MPPEPDLEHPGLDLDAVSDEFIPPDHGPEHFDADTDDDDEVT
jgi:hypothetical protein